MPFRGEFCFDSVHDVIRLGEMGSLTSLPAARRRTL